MVSSRPAQRLVVYVPEHFSLRVRDIAKAQIVGCTEQYGAIGVTQMYGNECTVVFTFIHEHQDVLRLLLNNIARLLIHQGEKEVFATLDSTFAISITKDPS